MRGPLVTAQQQHARLRGHHGGLVVRPGEGAHGLEAVKPHDGDELDRVGERAALATVLIHIALFGLVREADEGTAAHIFQLLMIAQVPIVAFFAIKWLPRTPRQALPSLALQAAAALAALAPVFFL